MTVKLALASADVKKYGYLLGTVKEVFPYLLSLEHGPLRMIPSNELQQYISQQKAFVIIRIEPLKDPSTISGYKWTTKNGPPFPLLEGTIADLEVIIEERRPISFLIPVIR